MKHADSCNGKTTFLQDWCEKSIRRAFLVLLIETCYLKASSSCWCCGSLRLRKRPAGWPPEGPWLVTLALNAFRKCFLCLCLSKARGTARAPWVSSEEQGPGRGSWGPHGVKGRAVRSLTSREWEGAVVLAGSAPGGLNYQGVINMLVPSSGASQVAPVVKNLPANAGDIRGGSDPWIGKIP